MDSTGVLKSDPNPAELLAEGVRICLSFLHLTNDHPSSSLARGMTVLAATYVRNL